MVTDGVGFNGWADIPEFDRAITTTAGDNVFICLTPGNIKSCCKTHSCVSSGAHWTRAALCVGFHICVPDGVKFDCYGGKLIAMLNGETQSHEALEAIQNS
jgi:hypothetical protein